MSMNSAIHTMGTLYACRRGEATRLVDAVCIKRVGGVSDMPMMCLQDDQLLVESPATVNLTMYL